MDKCCWCGDAPHHPNQCERDNCGESEVMYPSHGYLASQLEGGNAYVAGAIYDRKGKVRKRPLYCYRNDLSGRERKPEEVYPE